MTSTIFITGATDGIGRRTAESLAATGADLIIHGRTQAKLEPVIAALEAIPGHGRVQSLAAELSDLQAVRELATALEDTLGDRPLDVLLNNAGVFMTEAARSPQGHELTWAINHLTPALLCQLLLPSLRRSPTARCINVSSMVHKQGELRWDDFNFDGGFNDRAAYAQSKLAMVLFTIELARRLGDSGPIAVSLHPGVISTKLLVDGFKMQGRDSLDDGAATSIYLALLPAAELRPHAGGYFKRKQIDSVHPIAHDAQVCARLYERTCALLGVEPLSPR
ncbi:Retinol dehydrogenase 13 [Enhygromyxa salina]|uniref:Retinol dehydrogenase 13 n=1 Tax=Enhygromyxa salina TaxID=215803 RepID=A0A0C2D6W6_9BACT|nr:SDR family NAD(P)-dependent oxidoreductase [Enhygromyxa salina]KIG18941.1 Retinol dehydrogenase 13 [Enhygromyxa salina]